LHRYSSPSQYPSVGHVEPWASPGRVSVIVRKRDLRRNGWSNEFTRWCGGIHASATGGSRPCCVAKAGGCIRYRAQHKDHVWAWDFIFDRTSNGRSIKWLAIVDEYTRECLALEVNRGMTSEEVIDVLVDLFAIRGVPRHIRSDNGPEFIAKALRRWLKAADVGPLYIEPGAPWQNGYAESFFSRLRDELLAREEFETLSEAKHLSAAWQSDYNHHRPHSSLGYRTPAEFAAGCAASAPATPPLQQHSRKPKPVLS